MYVLVLDMQRSLQTRISAMDRQTALTAQTISSIANLAALVWSLQHLACSPPLLTRRGRWDRGVRSRDGTTAEPPKKTHLMVWSAQPLRLVPATNARSPELGFNGWIERVQITSVLLSSKCTFVADEHAKCPELIKSSCYLIASFY
jgi:hypothetical protein